MAKPVYDKPIHLEEWQHAAGKESGATRTHSLNTDQFGEENLSEEQRAYYKGTAEGLEHRDRLSQLKGTAAKNNYVRGLREGLVQSDRPKRGDINNPLKKDMPAEPRQPRERQASAPRPGAEIRRAQANARKWSILARKARGRRR